MTKYKWTRREVLSAMVLLPLTAPGRRWSYSQGLGADERREIVGYLSDTRDRLLASVRDLSQAQWRFTPAAGAWSIAQILEHVTLVEQSVFEQVSTAAQTRKPLPRDRRPGLRDQVVEMVVTNRTTTRFTSPEVFRPSNRWLTTLELVAAFTLQRRTTLDYAEATRDDLRSVAWENPVIGLIDGYQWLLFIGAHGDRHTKQVAEVRAHPAFPSR